MKNKFLQSVIYNSSIIFTVLCLFSTLFFALLYWSFDATSLPNLGVNFALLAISYIIAIVISIILYKLKKPYVTHKISFLYFATTLFTYLFISVHVFAVILGNLWGGITIASVLLLAILTTIIKYLPKIPYAVKVVINFFLYAIPYFGIGVFIGEYGKGNKMMILIFIYLLVFALAVVAVSVIRSFIKKQENKEEEYKKLF
ncbi:MAG: hypothetical protein J6A90_08580 [Clostridia bacterium]|nr:hypothetical protein [Clostridia bacterium]